MIQVAVMGYGTIGSGVVEVLETNKDKITEKTGKEIAVKYILDLREFPGDPHEAQIVHDFEIIEKDEEVEIVVEAMGGVNPAYKFAKACLLAGKHVVTSNKALVAAHGTELLAIAREKNLNFLFEASVGGGIPLLRPLQQQGLPAGHVGGGPVPVDALDGGGAVDGHLRHHVLHGGAGGVVRVNEYSQAEVLVVDRLSHGWPPGAAGPPPAGAAPRC